MRSLCSTFTAEAFSMLTNLPPLYPPLFPKLQLLLSHTKPPPHLRLTSPVPPHDFQTHNPHSRPLLFPQIPSLPSTHLPVRPIRPPPRLPFPSLPPTNTTDLPHRNPSPRNHPNRRQRRRKSLPQSNPNNLLSNTAAIPFSTYSSLERR